MHFGEFKGTNKEINFAICDQLGGDQAYKILIQDKMNANVSDTFTDLIKCRQTYTMATQMVDM